MDRQNDFDSMKPLVKRRDFIRAGSLPFLGISLAQSLRLHAATAATTIDPTAKAQS